MTGLHREKQGAQHPETDSSVEGGVYGALTKLREILLHKAIYNKRDLRMTVEGMLYRMRTGCPWRDLPEAFGNWNKVNPASHPRVGP